MSGGFTSDPGDKAKGTGGLLGKAKSDKTVDKAIKSKAGGRVRGTPARRTRASGRGVKGDGKNHGLESL
jgi:hypothetical protein